MSEETKKNLLDLSNKYIQSLSEIEKKNLIDYTENSYINEFLIELEKKRTEKIRIQFNYLKRIIILKSILNNSPVFTDGNDFYHFYKPNFYIHTFNNTEHDPSQTKKSSELKNGDTFVLPNFLSTTRDTESFKYFHKFRGQNCCIHKLSFNKMPCLFIEDISKYNFQKEVLLPPNILLRLNTTYQTVTHMFTNLPSFLERDHKGNYFIQEKNFTNLTLEESYLKTFELKNMTTYISKDILNDINLILKNYADMKESWNHDYDHISRVIIFSLIIISLLRKIDIVIIEEDILKIIYMCLFHDIGRNGKDGSDRDEWEQAGAQQAYDFLKEKKGEHFANEVKWSIPIISKQKENLLKIIYKSADSLDIIRTNNFDFTENSLFNYITQSTTITDAQKTLFIKEFTKIVNETHTLFSIVNGIETYDPDDDDSNNEKNQLIELISEENNFFGLKIYDKTDYKYDEQYDNIRDKISDEQYDTIKNIIKDEIKNQMKDQIFDLENYIKDYDFIKHIMRRIFPMIYVRETEPERIKLVFDNQAGTYKNYKNFWKENENLFLPHYNVYTNYLFFSREIIDWCIKYSLLDKNKQRNFLFDSQYIFFELLFPLCPAMKEYLSQWTITFSVPETIIEKFND